MKAKSNKKIPWRSGNPQPPRYGQNLQTDETANQAHAESSDRHDDERQNQGIVSHSPHIAGNPADRGSNQRRHVSKDSGHGCSSGTRLKHSFIILCMHHPVDEPGHNEHNGQTSKGRNRGSKQEHRNLGDKPGNKIHHVLRNKAPPRRNVQ